MPKNISCYRPPQIEIRTVAKFFKSDIKPDVLERLDGCEDFIDNYHSNIIFYPTTIKKILNTSEDDTNETTKVRLEEFYGLIKDADMVLIVDDI